MDGSIGRRVENGGKLGENEKIKKKKMMVMTKIAKAADTRITVFLMPEDGISVKRRWMALLRRPFADSRNACHQSGCKCTIVSPNTLIFN